MCCIWEVGHIANSHEDLCGASRADAGHGQKNLGLRNVLNELEYLGLDFLAMF
ncbi:hypothetical protein FRC0505_02447 [Corynebacterium diphtheriae]|nr:hypothetical protein FRC0314_02388 [Corynebacterium diphtheriae]CAB1017908.1 hypothetical protein FRC0505_02447 [Corynebacterium diphtheriae]